MDRQRRRLSPFRRNAGPRLPAVRGRGTGILLVLAFWLVAGMHIAHPLFHHRRVCCLTPGDGEFGFASVAGAGHEGHRAGHVSGGHDACPVCSFLALLGKYTLAVGVALPCMVQAEDPPRPLERPATCLLLRHTWPRAPPSLA